MFLKHMIAVLLMFHNQTVHPTQVAVAPKCYHSNHITEYEVQNVNIHFVCMYSMIHEHKCMHHQATPGNHS